MIAPACWTARTCASRTPARAWRRLRGTFDFAFVDGVKSEYEEYFDVLLPLLGTGAVLVVDNVLMGGSVAEGDTSERSTIARAFNERLLGHPDLTATVTPVGDGVLVAVKR